MIEPKKSKYLKINIKLFSKRVRQIEPITQTGLVKINYKITSFLKEE